MPLLTWTPSSGKAGRDSDDGYTMLLAVLRVYGHLFQIPERQNVEYTLAEISDIIRQYFPGKPARIELDRRILDNLHLALSN